MTMVKCVSVIMPIYNRANFLRVAIASIISQERITPQIIIIDDGSEDNTRVLLKEFISDSSLDIH